MKLRYVLVVLAFTGAAHAVVDMKTANFADTWSDVTVPGTGYDLKVQRTYNSRTIYSGIFGFGWCSDFETRLEITPEGALKVIECGAGAEILFTPKKFDGKKVDAVVENIIAEIKKRKGTLSDKAIAELKRDLKEDDLFREEFARRVNVKGSISKDTVYFANGRGNETVVRQKDNYKRTLADGTYQLFDLNGRLTHMYDRNANFLKLNYTKDLMTGVVDNRGRRLIFAYDNKTRKVSKISGPRGIAAQYVTKDENLVKVKTAANETFLYEYDDLHNMTKITMPDGKSKKITYNKDKDWVTSFQNTIGCTESYEYKVDPNDSKNHFWSTVVKRCGKEVTNKSTYEFFHKTRQDGLGAYLYRVRSDNNGSITDIVYHEVFGKPLSILRGGVRTDYTYFDNGFVRTKREGPRFMAFEYKNQCNKPSKVDIDFTPERQPTQKKEAAEKSKRTTTYFSYDSNKCNLIYAHNTDGQKVKLQYDDRGRITLIEDQSKKVVTLQYDKRFEKKPSIVTRPGLGTIKVSYKPNGEILKVDSDDGPRVAVQVASIFSNLLEIIAPASAEANI